MLRPAAKFAEDEYSARYDVDMALAHVRNKHPHLDRPGSVLTVVGMDPVAKTVKLKHDIDPGPTGYNYPYVHSYIPVLGEKVVVHNMPDPWVVGPYADANRLQPTIAAGTGIGTGPTLTWQGPNQEGWLQITVGTTPTTTGNIQIAVVTFEGVLNGSPVASPLPGHAIAQITPTNNNTMNLGTWGATTQINADTISSDSITIRCNLAIAPVAGTLYTVSVHIRLV